MRVVVGTGSVWFQSVLSVDKSCRRTNKLTVMMFVLRVVVCAYACVLVCPYVGECVRMLEASRATQSRSGQDLGWIGQRREGQGRAGFDFGGAG